MKHRATAALAAVAALTALTACSSNDEKPAPAKSSASATPDALKAAGIPPKPTGQTRTNLLAALRKISPTLVADQDKAIDNSRNQCSAINSKSAKVDWSAQQRFGTSTHNVSEAEAKEINAALATFCKTA
ncbi:hypothetical protein ACFV2U_21230 [Streptomyces sp. NPDC059697]|uniref:hypothetical protein n=1 Tax=Streptomyces sp. NPDC059697 TaxID=3346912 RepID=UPI0036AB5D66